MENLKIISTTPLVFAYKDEIYINLISKLLNKILNTAALPFEFKNNKGTLVKEKYRYSYPMRAIFEDKEVAGILKNFAINTVPKFLKKLKDEINETNYQLINKENIRYCLRVRVFEDKEGYSLQPHKDSDDTIFSFIMQLDSINTKTALYHKGRLFKLSGNISKNQEGLLFQIASEIKKICPFEKLQYGQSQFKKNIGIWTNTKFFRYEVVNDYIALQEYDEEIIDVEDGSIYGISNSLIDFISSSKLDEANSVHYHGVRPTIQKNRKLLIMDLIAKPTSNNVLIMQGVKEDLNSYYLIYSPEKCSELTDLLS